MNDLQQQRRESDLKFWRRVSRRMLLFKRKRKSLGKDIWLLVVTGIALAGVAGALDDINRIQESRRLSIGLTCSTLSATIKVGKEVIDGQGPFAQFKTQRTPAQTALSLKVAATYARSISSQVQEQVGRKGDGLVRPDGTVDCRRFEQVSNLHNVH